MGKRWYVIGILAMLTVVFAYHPAPVFASSKPCGINYTWLNVAGTPDRVQFWETDYSTTTPFLPLSRNDNSYIQGVKFQENTGYLIAQTYTTTWDCTPRSVQMIWRRGNTNSASALIETSPDGITWTTRATQSVSVGGVANVNLTLTWTNTTSVTYRYVRTRVFHSAGRIASFYIDSDPAPETQLIKPLTNTDEYSMDDFTVGTYTHVKSETILNFKPVHAPADSVVMGIEPLTVDICNGLNMPNCNAGGAYSIDLSNTYVVYLRTYENDELSYIVANAPNYLKTEEPILGGCIMGETFRTTDPTKSATISTDGTDYLLSRYTLAPNDEATPCYVEGQDEDDIVCQLGTERMAFIYNNAQKSNGVTYDGTVIRIPVGGSMFQAVALPQNERVYAEIVASGTSAKITFGQDVQFVDLSDTLQPTIFDWRYVTRDIGTLTTIAIENTGNTEITISDICVAFESDNPPDSNEPELPPQPPTCYFYNHSFDLALAGWSSSDDFVTSRGRLYLPFDGTISQLVNIYPGQTPPTYYDLTVSFSLWTAPTFSSDPLDPANISEITVFYRYPDGASLDQEIGEPTTVHTIYSYQFQYSEPFTLSTQIPVVAAMDGNFTLSVAIDTPMTGLEGILVNSVCLQPNDGNWYGYEPTPEAQLVTEQCEAPEDLVGNESNMLIMMLARHIRDSLQEFIECKLMKAVNGLYAQTRAAGLIARATGDWVGQQAVPYVGGYLANMFDFGNGVNFDAGDLTSIFNSIATIPNDFFGLLAWVTTTFFGILARIVQNFVTIFRALIEFIQTLISIGNEIIRVWRDTTASALPGLDDCQIAPETKTRCIIFWMLENTILGQPYGYLIVPVITSALVIVALSNLYVQVKRLINKVVGAT